jgi:pyocin large subunit-like protein
VHIRCKFFSALLLTIAFACGMSILGSSVACAQQKQIEELNFADAQRLDEHWRKHGQNRKEFDPALSKDQYLKRARDFFSSDLPEILHKRRPNGDSLRYRPSTNEFGVLSGRRIIRTYFRPDSGMRYWERQ